jgi:hypothetical protein
MEAGLAQSTAFRDPAFKEIRCRKSFSGACVEAISAEPETAGSKQRLDGENVSVALLQDDVA